jgi:hypothetical protein
MGCDISLLGPSPPQESTNIPPELLFTDDLSGQWKGTGYTSISPLVTLSLDISHNQETGDFSGTYRLSRNSFTTKGKVSGYYISKAFLMRLLSPDEINCYDDFSLARPRLVVDTMDVSLSGTDCLGEHKDGMMLLVRM